jgi:hypothetical protein
MLSKYAEGLCGDAKMRYLSKLTAVNGVDPYTLTGLVSSVLPMVEATDLVNYLVLGTSAYTWEQFRAYRSLESYNQFQDGWVKDVGGCLIDNKYVVVSKVS